MPAAAIEVLLPLNGKILFIKDKPKDKTKGGIILPSDCKIEVLTGRVIEMSQDIKECPQYKYLRKFDKVIVNFAGAVPLELEADNQHYLLPVTSVMGVWRKKEDIEEDGD